MLPRSVVIFALLSALFFAVHADRAGAQCGPGGHWIDDCAEGEDTWQNISMEVSIDITGDCESDGVVLMTGSGSIHHANPGDDSQNYPGTRPVDGHLDVIDTEIISMDLSGSLGSAVIGAGRGQNNNLAPSPGVIAEQPDNYNADSFFDVFCEAYVNGMYLYNQTAARLEGTINRIPPYGSVYTFSECLPAYTSPIPGQGVLVGHITHVTMTIEEPAGVPTLSQWGIALFGLLLIAAVSAAAIKKRSSIVMKA